MDPYRVEPAKSNRSKCKACKGEIAKEQLRFGSLMEVSPGHGSYSWRCLSCITAKQVANVEAKVGSAENVDGFDALSKGAQTQFRKAIDAALKKGGAGAKAKGKAAAAPKGKAAPKAIPLRPPPLKDQHAFLDLAKSHNFAKVREFVEKNPAFANVQPSGRWTALHQAAEHGDVGTVKFLIEKGARVDLVNKDGHTATDVAKNAAIKALLVPKAKKRGAAASGDAPAAKRKTSDGALAFFCAKTDPLSALGCEDVQSEDPFKVQDLNSAKAGKAKAVAKKLAGHLDGAFIPAGESDCSPLSFVVVNPLESKEDTMFKVLGLMETDEDGLQVRDAMSLEEVCWDEFEAGFCMDEQDEEEEDMYAEGVFEKVQAATVVLAEETEDHFRINFSDDVVCAPVVWAGMVEGSIVGVLGMRVWT
mmetsp:Transcript_6554/g.11385  ORF Transcript_6554/g.11385 Transcript_6554/m.11385 type:complete len:418 (+) Transcript_6554:65-1318(+)